MSLCAGVMCMYLGILVRPVVPPETVGGRDDESSCLSPCVIFVPRSPRHMAGECKIGLGRTDRQTDRPFGATDLPLSLTHGPRGTWGQWVKTPLNMI